MEGGEQLQDIHGRQNHWTWTYSWDVSKRSQDDFLLERRGKLGMSSLVSNEILWGRKGIKNYPN